MIEPPPFVSKPEDFVPFMKALGLKVRFQEKGITGKGGELILRGPHPEWKEIWQFVENQP